MISRDIINRPESIHACPDCGAARDSANAICDQCDFDPSDESDTDPDGANMADGLTGAVVLAVFMLFTAAWMLVPAHKVDAMILEAQASVRASWSDR